MRILARIITSVLLFSVACFAQGVRTFHGQNVTAAASGCAISDSFVAADGTALGTYSASWTVTSGSYTIQSNAVYPASAANNMAFWNGCTPTAKQYASLTFTSTPSTLAGVAVRIQAGANQGYRCVALATNIYLQMENGGGESTLGSATITSIAAGDTIRAEANGSSISCKVNGSVVVGPFTDTTYATGKVGLADYNDASSSRGSPFTGGDF